MVHTVNLLNIKTLNMIVSAVAIYEVKFHSFCFTGMLKISLLNQCKYVFITLCRKSWKMQWVRPTISTRIWMTSLVGWHRQRQRSTIWNQWAELSPMSLNKYRNKRYVPHVLEFSIWKSTFVSLNRILTKVCSNGYFWSPEQSLSISMTMK